MPQLPSGEPSPADGSLPEFALTAYARGGRPFGLYVHVPFCAVRCGYCDFNTYTLGELAGARGATTAAYAVGARAEIRLAGEVLRPGRALDTVFFGGGTPTMLPTDELVALLEEVEQSFGLAPGAEVTVEANPDTVDPQRLTRLAAAGVTRLSVGMQSAVPHVLATLDRTHGPSSVPAAVAAARDAGLQTSLDLIYGIPGESLADWRRSLEAALDTGADHISAYALVVEDGTALARRVRRGEVLAPDPDDEAAKYEIAEEVLQGAGFAWYEVSNWARDPAARSRHNLGYWVGGDWWGIGPGAHSHVGGVRWWNHKHPTRYTELLGQGRSPAAAREVLTPRERLEELVMLRLRLADGLPLDHLEPAGRARVGALVADGLVEGVAAVRDRTVVLTLRGRLLADLVVRELLSG